MAGIAHEINTPMGAISSVDDTLRRAVDKLKVVLAEGSETDTSRRQGGGDPADHLRRQ